jgi:hypothetical protein
VGKATWSTMERGEAIAGVGRYWHSPCNALRGCGDSKQGAGSDSADLESGHPAVGSGSRAVPVGNSGRQR